MLKSEIFTKLDSACNKHNPQNNPLLNKITIRTLHRLCCHSEKAGTYRTTSAASLGPGHIPPVPEEIDHFMHHFMNQMQTSHIMFHPVEFAIIAYKRLLDIFPFESHNEETAVLFMNLLLAQSGYSIADDPSGLEGYEKAMEQARTMPFPDTDPLVKLIAESLIK